MSKKYALFLTLLFCLYFGGGMVLHLLTPDREKSEVENRTLQQLPALSLDSVLDGSFMSDVEKYIADQFPGRDEWVTVKARTEQMVGKKEFHDVFLCGDRLIARVPQPEAGTPEKNLSFVKALADKTEIPVYLGFIPSAAEIWKDRLPAADSFNQAAFLRQAEELGLPTVDYLEMLLNHRGEELYYHSDHHWTSLGAYYGYASIAKAMDFPAKPLDAYSPERVTADFNGTLYSNSGVHWLEPDSIELYVPEEEITVTSWRNGKAEPGQLYERSWLEKKDKYSLFLGGNQPLCVVENPAARSGEKLLIIRDSYADSLTPFLAEEFAEVHLIDLRYYKDSVAGYAEKNEIDAILLSYSVPNFLTDKNLAFLGR